MNERPHRPPPELTWRDLFCMGAGVYPDAYPGEEAQTQPDDSEPGEGEGESRGRGADPAQ